MMSLRSKIVLFAHKLIPIESERLVQGLIMKHLARENFTCRQHDICLRPAILIWILFLKTYVYLDIFQWPIKI